TQQNAALVEEMAAAASSLNNQAQSLVETVAVFKLSAHEQSRTAVAAPMAPASVASTAKPIKAAHKPAKPSTRPATSSSPAAEPPASLRRPAIAAPQPAAAAQDGGDWESF
ncbi:MAG: hypothetical protein RR715_13435, partial [Comamonas sp.]